MSAHRLVVALVLGAFILTGNTVAGLPRFEQHGITVSYPAGWHVSPRPMSNLINPTFRFTIATFVPKRARGDKGPCLSGLARKRAASGAYVYLLEDLEAHKHLRRFPRQPTRFRLPAAGEVSICDGRWSRWIPFRQAGRAFYLGISVGPNASAKTRSELRRILGSLSIVRARSEQHLKRL